MRVPLVVVLLLAASAAALAAPDYEVFTDHPRILLTRNRLRLLQRERERRSARWTQFETLVSGGASMPEPGFSGALYWRAAGDRNAGQRAVAWALGPGGRDLRQLAIVFDWCQDLLDETQSRTLAGRLRTAVEQTASDNRLAAVRARLLAAVALAGHPPDPSVPVLQSVIAGWWRKGIVPALKAGRDPIASADYYALFEMLHVIRDNLAMDLRESDPDYFKELPARHLLSYYPATYPAGENDFRIPAAKAAAGPDLRNAALARAADLAIVAYDLNSPGGQFLQGWLMHDRFQLRGAFGAPYEFLWANPYQPGLSYYHVPLVCHDPRFGRLFVRSTWDESAAWFGTVDGELQSFREGRITVLDPRRAPAAPLALTEALVFFAAPPLRWEARLEDEEQVFVLGLESRRKYQIEVDDQEIEEQTADPGGILAVPLPHKTQTGFRLRVSPQR